MNVTIAICIVDHLSREDHLLRRRRSWAAAFVLYASFKEALLLIIVIVVSHVLLVITCHSSNAVVSINAKPVTQQLSLQ